MVVINPFSDKYRKYLNIDLNNMDSSLIRLAIARSNRKNNEKYLELDEEKDIVSFFLLMQSLAKSPHSPEVLASVKAFESLIRNRLSNFLSSEVLEEMRTLITIFETPELLRLDNPLKKSLHVSSITTDIPKEDLYRLREQKKGEIEFAVEWGEVYDAINLSKHYVVGPYLFLTRIELISIYARLLKRRSSSYVMEISPRIQDIDHPKYAQISSMVKNLVKVPRKLESVSGTLSEDMFPPCVKIAMQGVSSGLRNYAITILLTSFLSYARLMPSTKVFDRGSSLSLEQSDIELLLNEVIPEIIESGDRCDPPFFKEHPIEKLNIFYHLGFGMKENPNVSDYGKSKWYLPPSCAKVAENAPLLCQPDEFCNLVSWGVLDREKVDAIVNRAKEKNKFAIGEKVLEMLITRPMTFKSLSEKLEIEDKELANLLRTMAKNNLIGKKKITNPLIYYIRKKRTINRKLGTGQ